MTKLQDFGCKSIEKNVLKERIKFREIKIEKKSKELRGRLVSIKNGKFPNIWESGSPRILVPQLLRQAAVPAAEGIAMPDVDENQKEQKSYSIRRSIGHYQEMGH